MNECTRCNGSGLNRHGTNFCYKCLGSGDAERRGSYGSRND